MVGRRLIVVAALRVAPVAAAASDPPYSSSVTKIPPSVKRLITGKSWHKGCPVRLRDLRLVHVRYHRFSGKVSDGRLIVHRDVANDVAATFGRLYENGYPIRRIRLVDNYGANDYRSIEADNTSALNCRYVDGTTRGSNHAYGRAIDLNPLENPYVYADGTTSHPRSERYVDRSTRRHPAMILAGDATVDAFAAAGWGWGGVFAGAKDYQHFSANGR